MNPRLIRLCFIYDQAAYRNEPAVYDEWPGHVPRRRAVTFAL